MKPNLDDDIFLFTMEPETASGLPHPMNPDRRIHRWARALEATLRGLGLKTSEVTATCSRAGFCSAYFAVHGIGEVRVSDHPPTKHTTSDLNIFDVNSLKDVCAKYADEHNRRHELGLIAVNRTPFLLLSDSESIARWNKKQNRVARIQEEEEMAREFWQKRVAESGLEGSFREVKSALKIQGVKFIPPERMRQEKETDFWKKQVAESGLEGSHRKIKKILKRQGVRFSTFDE